MAELMVTIASRRMARNNQPTILRVSQEVHVVAPSMSTCDLQLMSLILNLLSVGTSFAKCRSQGLEG